jgi:hypothetical protein
LNIEYKKRLISIVLSINILATGSLMSGCEFNNNKTSEDVPVSSSSAILDYNDLNNILSKVDGFVHILNYKEENNYYVGTFKNDNDVIYKLIDKYGNILEDDYIDVNIVNDNKVICNSYTNQVFYLFDLISGEKIMINSTSIDIFNNYILVNNTKELDIVDSNGTSKKSLVTETNVMDLNGNYLFDKEFNSYVKNSELGLLFLDKDNICTVFDTINNSTKDIDGTVKESLLNYVIIRSEKEDTLYKVNNGEFVNTQISAKNLKFSIESDENIYLCYYYTVNKGNLYQTFYDIIDVNANKIISNINYDKDVILFNSDNYIYIEGNIIGSNLLDGSMIAHSYFDEYMVYNDIVLFRYQSVYSYIDKDGYIKTSECKDFNELKDFVSSSNVLSLNNN